MGLPVISWILSLVLMLGSLAAAAAERSPVHRRPPLAASGDARVIVKYKADSGLLRSQALGASAAAPPQQAQALGNRLGLALRYLRAPASPAVSAINAAGAWATSTGSSSIVVAVLDTGVRFDHPDLAANLLAGYDSDIIAATRWAAGLSVAGVPANRHPATYSDGDNPALGTSFSTPLFSGTAALMLSVNKSLKPAQVASLLASTARRFPASGADAGVSACQAPGATPQNDECYCTTSTCGAGMLDAKAAVVAAAGGSSGSTTPVASAPAAAISVADSTVAVGDRVALRSTASKAGSGASITGYAWEITSGASHASLSGATDAASATLLAASSGSVTVRLTVTDSAGVSASSSQTFSVGAAVEASASDDDSGAGGGGGAVHPGWGLALLAAVSALGLRRRQ